MAKESSFFEKLKKGMGIEGPIEEKIEEVEEKPRMKRVKKPRELKIKTEPVEPKVEVEVSQPVTKEEEETTALPPPSRERAPEVEVKKEKWFESEGQLAIDVYQTKNELVIQSAIAGVNPENLDISIEGDVITIRGNREKSFEDATYSTAPENYFAQECYWGPFSREVILPVEVDPSRVEAAMKEGILTIRIPKILREKKRKVSIKSE